MASAVLGISVILQIITAWLALRLIRITGTRAPWILLATGFTLMAVRRIVSLSELWFVQGYKADLSAELVALSISIVTLLGVALIRPLIEALSHARSTEAANRQLQEVVKEQFEQLHLTNDALHRRIQELELAERQSRTLHRVSEVLSEATGFEEALPKCLQATCRHLVWDLGEFWQADQNDKVLHRTAVWHKYDTGLEAFAERARKVPLKMGEGLAGRVWEKGRAEWNADLATASDCPRMAAAEEHDLHAACGVPVLSGEECLGVLLFISRDVRPIDHSFQAAMTAIGSQIGQFVERTQAEEEVKLSRQRFQAFMDNSPAIAFMKDADGRYVYVNRLMEKTFEFVTSEWLGKDDHQLWPHKYVTAFRHTDQSVLARSTPATVEETVPDADGGERTWLSLKFPLIDLNGENFLGGMAIDISDRKEAQQQLRDRQRQIASLISNLPGFVYRSQNTPDRPMEFISLGCKNITGYSPHDFTSHRTCLGDLIHPDDQTMVWDQVQEALRERRQFQVVYRVRTADGNEKWLWEQGTGIFGDDGQLSGLEGHITDITQRKQMEENLRQTEKQFHQAQKLEAIGRLAGGIAHDFNNVVTVINGYCDILSEEIPSDDPKHEMIEVIKDAGTRASSMTRQLLSFSRKQVLAPKMFPVNAVIGDMEKMLLRLIGEDVQLRTALDPDAGYIKADPSQIEQVVMNLVINARDAMPQGGKLTIETRSVELDSSYADSHWEVQPGPYTMLAISDNGCGMDQKTIDQIFEPFFTTKEEGKGTGLGLATVFGIAKQSKGHVGVYSEPGHGTTFKIYFPEHQYSDGEHCVTPPAVTRSRGSETILLVEDEVTVRALARQVLEKAGYRVLTARDGSRALKRASEFDGLIHLLLTDVVMPKTSGRSLAEELVVQRPAMRVLFTSGYTDDAIVHHGVLEAEVAFLQKPFTPDDLKRKVREVLDAVDDKTLAMVAAKG